MLCNYCPEKASARVPAVSSEVCVTHAIQFWTELLACARKQRSAEWPAGLTPVTAGRSVEPVYQS